MKILVTGSLGMIGVELTKKLGSNALCFGHKEEPRLDVLDYPKAREIILSSRPDVIIHLAAKTDLDSCEKDAQACYDTNVSGTENLVAIAREAGAMLVYPSTFYVYGGGKNGAYDDRVDCPKLENIHSVYAKSKFMGEESVRKGLERYFIVRLGALFGGGRKDKKFVAKIINLAKTTKEIRAVSDRIIQPSSVKDTVGNLLALIKTQNYGTYNMVGHGSASYFEYAKAILEYAGFTGVSTIPIKSADFKENARREKNLSVINGKLQDIGLDLMRDWQPALKDYIEELKLEGLVQVQNEE